MKLVKIKEALADLHRGEKVVFVRDEAHLKDGYLVMAAEKATGESIEFMTAHGTGYLGLALTSERTEALRLPQTPVAASAAPFSPALGLGGAIEDSVGDAQGAEAQAAAVRALADPETRPGEVRLPRRIVPLRAMPGGVVACATPVEAAVDLARLSGLRAMGVVCKILTPKGNGGSAARLEAFALRHGLKVVSIAALIAHRRRDANTQLVSLPAPVRLPTRYGVFRAQVYEDPLTGVHHMAVIMGDVANGRPVLTRMHSECLTGDVLGSLRCDCGPQLERALELIATAGHGVVLYLRQEGRGIGLYNKLRTYALQERGLDTVEANEQLGFPADLRDYGVAGQMLAHLGVRTIRLLTNNPRKIESLQNSGVQVVERVSLIVSASKENRRYLRTKQEKLGHFLMQEEEPGRFERVRPSLLPEDGLTPKA